MGTNYYWHEGPNLCPTCGHDPAGVYHIGKSSSGWTFSLNTHPDRGIHNLQDWVHAFSNGKIVDEYGIEITDTEMCKVILQRRRDNPVDWTPQVFAQNHAEPGPNNLVRHIVDGIHCIAHGDGTYDLMRGEFC